MSNRLDGKVALVTGGSSGLGKATALAFGREGACVVVAARKESEIRKTAAQIEAEGGRALAVVTDVTDPDQVRHLIATTVDTFGRLDVAFNNAGVFPPETMIHETDDATFDQLIDVNLRGTWLCMKAELPHMLEQHGGSIINMASSAGLSGWSDNPAYAASKHAVVGLTRSAALQYAPSGIRINAVCPAFTEIEAMQGIDPQAHEVMKASIPLGRIGRAEETAEAVTWLASDASSFCVGHTLVLDGGQSIGLWHRER